MAQTRMIEDPANPVLVQMSSTTPIRILSQFEGPSIPIETTDREEINVVIGMYFEIAE